MNYVHGKAIKQIDADEGKRRVEIVARNDGKFQFFEYKQDVECGRPYWLSMHDSGLYESEEAAERDGRAKLDARISK